MGAILERLEKSKASIRAKGEHPFRVIKRQFGDTALPPEIRSVTV
jgi:IS5 family transposase